MVVPYGSGRNGALATQAFANPFYGIDGLRMLQEGCSAEETVAYLTGADQGRDHRQLHMIDRQGCSAAHTGSACLEWSGSIAAFGVSVAGNMLAGPKVLDDTLAAYLDGLDRDFDERLIIAMEAGDRAGGDRRGRQSCALKIWSKAPFPRLDLRVDDHPEPLAELRRIWRLAHEGYVPFQSLLPSRADPVGCLDRDAAYRVCAEHAEAWRTRHSQGV